MEDRAEKTGRIESIDFAKGLAMLLVIYDHVFYYYDGSFDVCYDLVKAIHIPTFFVLSGYLFNERKQLGEYLKGKLNTLLVPFFAFWLILGNLIPAIGSMLGSRTYTQWNVDFLLSGIWNERMFERPLWFLWALFWVSCLYYALHKYFCQSHQQKTCAVAFIVGLLGVWLGINQIALPFYSDSILTAFLFYAVGHWLGTLHLLSKIKSRLLVLLGSVVGIIFTKVIVGDLSYVSNEFYSSFWCTLLIGLVGSLSVIAFSAGVNYNRFINFVGKNSLIFVCIHLFVLRLLLKFEEIFIPVNNLASLLLLFISITIVCSLLVPIINKNVPILVGKKPLIK